MAHITGGGLIENLPRILPEGLEFKINKGSWDVPQVFNMIQKIGRVEDGEMYRTFNMGIGYVIIAPEEEADGILKAIEQQGVKSWVIAEYLREKVGWYFAKVWVLHPEAAPTCNQF